MPNPNMAARNPDHLALVEDDAQEVSETIGAKVETKDPCAQHYGPNLEDVYSLYSLAIGHF